MILTQANRAPRIFIAEDDPAIRELVMTRLKLSGFDVQSAGNGWQAVQDIQVMRPHAILLDINMPGMDGFGVLRSIRRNKTLSATPIMMLTARGALEDVRRCLADGANDYLTKPFDDQELITRVHRLVRPPRVMPPEPPPAPAPAAPAGQPDDGALLL